MIICLLIPVSAVSASDINNTAADNQVLSATPNVDTISANVNNGENNNDTLSVNDEKNILSAGLESGSNNLLGAEEITYYTFSDLDKQINLVDNYLKLNNNYKYNPSTDTQYTNGITISKEMTIDFNEKMVTGSGITSLFNVEADNVIFKNLKLENITDVQLPIYWGGANGQLIDSQITNVYPTMQYTDGKKYCIYFDGVNQTVKNSKFKHNAAIRCSSLHVLNSTFRDYDYYSLFSGMGVTLKISYCNFTNHTDWITFLLRANLEIDHINVTKSTHGISDKGHYIVKDSYFGYNNITNKYLLAGGPQISKCVFEHNNATNSRGYALISSDSTQGGSMAGVLVNNSIFKENWGYLFYINMAGFTVEGCDFINNKMNTISVSQESFTLNKCNFEGNIIDGDAIVKSSANRFIVNNTQFISNTMAVAPIYITAGNRYLNNNGYTNNINSTGDESSVYDLSQVDYIPKNRVVVSSDGIGYIGNDSNPCNLTTALSLVSFGGEIYLKNGIYNDLTTMKSIYCNIVGESEKGVIINKGTFSQWLYNGTIKKITFNDSTNYLTFSAGFVKAINCTFDNMSTTYIVSGVVDYAYNWNLFNITVKNAKSSHFFASQHGSRYRYSLNYHLENITFYKCTFTDNFLTLGSPTENTFRNFTLIDSKINVGIASSNVASSENNYKYFLKNPQHFEDFTFKNCTVTNQLIYNNYLGIVNLKNFKLYNITFTSNNYNFLNMHNTFNIDGFTIDDTRKTNNNTLFSVYSDATVSFKNVNIINGFNATTLIDNSGSISTFNGFTLNDVIMNSLFSNEDNVPDIMSNLVFSNIDTNKSNIIFTMPSNHKLKDSIFENYTGHIIISGANVEVENTEFIKGNNSELNGSALVINGDYVIVRNCTFTSNNASYGAVYTYDRCIKPAFYNCNFTDNNAKHLGGAIFVNSTDDSNVLIAFSGKTEKTFNNENDHYNNFYYNGKLQVLLGNVFVVLNQNDPKYAGLDHTGSERDDPINFTSGVNIAGPGATITFVNNSEIYDYNSLLNGALAGQFITFDTNDLTFIGNDTTIINLKINVTDKASGLNVYNMTFTGVDNGEVIYVESDNCKMENCVFKDNGGNQVTKGAAINIVKGQNLTLINCNFTNNKVTGDNGIGGALYINASTFRIINCNFESNTARFTGSHIYLEKNVKDILIQGSNFTKGTVQLANGGIFVQGGEKIIITGNNFTNNYATQGAGLYISGSETMLSISENNFTDNVADRGGALYIANKNFDNNILDNRFSGNNATDNGGALYIGECIGINQLVLSGNTFEKNNAINDGGALYIDSDSLNVETSDFRGNNATNGGGVYVNKDNVILKALNFTANNATNGGGLFVNGINTNIYYSSFTANNATNGGGVYVNLNGTLFNHCNFTANNANVSDKSYGSAIYVADNVNLGMDYCRVENNRVFGGADDLHADISYDGILPSISNTIFGETPYKQYANNRTAAKIYYELVYVAMNYRGHGYGNDTATTMDKALDGILPNGVIIICDDNYIWNDDFKRLTNLMNCTIVGLTNKTTIKRNSTQQENKYLFILPNAMKNK